MKDSAFWHTVVLIVLAGVLYTVGKLFDVPDLGVLGGLVAGWAAPSPKAMMAAAKARASQVPPEPGE